MDAEITGCETGSVFSVMKQNIAYNYVILIDLMPLMVGLE